MRRLVIQTLHGRSVDVLRNFVKLGLGPLRKVGRSRKIPADDAVAVLDRPFLP